MLSAADTEDSGAQPSSERRTVLFSHLRSWAGLHEIITALNNEAEIKWMMQTEVAGSNRIRILERLYSRYCVLRKERERRGLSEGKLPF